MPGRWKVFRIMCVLQVLIAGLCAGYSFFYMLFLPTLFNVLDAFCFTAVGLFAALGISLINRNYPDIPPEGAQKRYFNWLYLINFFLIAYLAAHVYSEKTAVAVAFLYAANGLGILWLILPVIMYFMMFLLQIYILFRMFRLRRELYANYIRVIDNLGEQI
jgi:hypothetical protein